MPRRPAHAGLAALAAAAALAAPAAALAHTEVTATRPANGASVAVAPAAVRVTYGGPMVRVTAVSVTARGRRVAATGRLDPGDARVAVLRLRSRPAGAYVVKWTVLGPDGHSVQGSLRFTARKEAS